jgi:formylglycine-generating enzyme required for sulfatase activity
MDHSRIIMIVCSLGLFALFMLVPITTWAADNGEADFAKGWDLLKHKKYKEARAALETGMKKNPSNALAHFYLADACRGLKDWSCAEEHYETSLELDAKLSTADLAKTRLKKAKVWRLLDEAKATIADSKAPPEKVQSAQDTLEIANKLGLDDEQRAVYQQLQEKLQAGLQPGADKAAEANSEPGQSGAAPTTAAGQQHEMTGKDGAPMVLVPAGEFMMGDNQGSDDEKPAHRVHLDAFYMDKYEVTVGQYAKFLEATGLEPPTEWATMNKSQHQKRPVVYVDWSDANTYCRWAGKRLPTEAEWEKAARGTDGRMYPWGNDPPDRLRANYGKEKWNDHQALVPVGTLHDGKSPYGIYDMAGNVWEWTSDWYDKNAYKNSSAQNPKGAVSGEYKVLRGGSWYFNPQYLRSAFRNLNKPTNRINVIGFRCAKTP